MYASLLSFLIVLILTPLVIRLFHFSSPIKPELEEHKAKAGTPALGSLSIFIGSLSAFIFTGIDDAGYIYLLALILGFAIGFTDDLLKVLRKSPDGMKSLTKLFFQLLSAVLLSYLVRREGLYSSVAPYLYYPLAVLLIAAFLNAANITDGLDTLEVKCVLPVLFLSAVLYRSLSAYLLPFAFALAAFLFYNSKPASIFMGDGGSHMCGMVLAVTALLSGEPYILVIASLVMFIEMATSFIQIFSIRCFHRKVFTIAPVHHAFQKRGAGESKIADSYFAVTLLCSLIAFLLSSYNGGAV